MSVVLTSAWSKESEAAVLAMRYGCFESNMPAIKQTELVETVALLALNLFQAMTTALAFESTHLNAAQMKGVLK